MVEIKSNPDAQKEQKEYTQNDLDRKMLELAKLEKELFSGSDGLIGGESKDTKIDREYQKGLNEATDIKTKIDLVNKLLNFFQNHIDFKFQKESKYIDDEDRNVIDKIQKETQDLIKNYQKYEESIVYYIKDDFKRVNFLAEFYEKQAQETGKKLNLELISIIIKQSYKILLSDKINYLKEYILFIDNNKNINNKQYFLHYFIKNRIGFGVDYNLGIKKIDEIYKLKFFTEMNFMNEEENVCNLLKIPLKDLKYIDKLFKEGKQKKIVNYIENNHQYRDDLLNILSIQAIYLEEKKNEYGLNDENIFSGLGVNIIELSKIVDKNTKNAYIDFFKKYKNLKEIEKEEYISKFLEKLKDKIDILKSGDINDINYELDILFFFSEINSKIKKNYLELLGLFEDKINDKIKDIERQLNDLNNLNELYRYKKSVNEILKLGGQKNIGEKIKFYESFGHKTSLKKVNEPEKEKEKISELKRQEMQKQADKLGLKVEISNEGKMVGKNGEENIKQKIGNKSQIEINANGELILINSMGYEMKYQNNSNGLEKSLETSEMFDYLDKIGFGYFGKSFKEMLESIRIYLPDKALYLNIDENNGNFLSMRELNEIIIPIFKNIGFIDKSQNIDYLAPDEITDTVMSHRISQIDGGESFQKGKQFNHIIFGELLQRTNK